MAPTDGFGGGDDADAGDAVRSVNRIEATKANRALPICRGNSSRSSMTLLSPDHLKHLVGDTPNVLTAEGVNHYVDGPIQKTEQPANRRAGGVANDTDERGDDQPNVVTSLPLASVKNVPNHSEQDHQHPDDGKPSKEGTGARR